MSRHQTVKRAFPPPYPYCNFNNLVSRFYPPSFQDGGVSVCPGKQQTDVSSKIVVWSSLSGSKMERYHVLELIGEGSFGKVYKGRKKYSGQVS